MNKKLLDNPLLISMMFFPRRGLRGSSRIRDALDGTIPVGDGIEIGYRFFPHEKDSPVILYFHGNGEVASDYDTEAPYYHQIGASLLVVDYRGYGWSTGSPLVSALMEDCDPIMAALPDILAQAGCNGNPLYVMGRSLGSIAAIHTAHQHPDRLKGLIIESGLAHLVIWLGSKGLPQGLLSDTPDPIGNIEKMKEIHLPLLVIHGEEDTLLTVKHGQALFDASPAAQKSIFRVPRGGHNNLLMYAGAEYHARIARLITDSSAG